MGRRDLEGARSAENPEVKREDLRPTSPATVEAFMNLGIDLEEIRKVPLEMFVGEDPGARLMTCERVTHPSGSGAPSTGFVHTTHDAVHAMPSPVTIAEIQQIYHDHYETVRKQKIAALEAERKRIVRPDDAPGTSGRKGR